MNLVVTETRPYQTLNFDDPKCLACGTPIPPALPPACPDPDCGASYFNDSMPVMEDWPIEPSEYDNETPFVTALVSLNNGATWDWCDRHREYEEDHPLVQRSCSYLAAEARMLRPARDTYLSAPPELSDTAYWEIRRRIDNNLFFRPQPA